MALLLVLPSAVGGQALTRPQIPWRTISTVRFDFHFPAEMEQWTRVVAQRMESVANAVDAVVGNKPASRITVIVEDPTNIANGFALPFLEGPVIFLWPTPPSPSPTFGAHRGWGEALAVHEYGHIAHLTFPSRNPRERLLWKLMPVQISPVTRKSPAWLIEGYATLIEGQLTGSGRPHSSGRAAVLRQWALEGRFPTYGQLNATGTFLGGNMRYLVGSAFLEWLQQRKGDSSLVHLWRRMSARQDRSFEEAFAGVFGAPPADLYGAFIVDVMERSLQVRARLRAAGLAEGDLVQRLTGGTGEPAVSPDGSRLAIVLRSLSGPSRLVVWTTHPPPDSLRRLAAERMLRIDPLDVAAFDSFPQPRRALATLHPANGRSHEQPRWMLDGVRILVTRDEPTPDGVIRPDLFMWNTRSGAVRRVTRGASVRQADPSPNGREAVAVRCHSGTCSVVMITLQSGTWRVLVAGNPDLVWHRPRYSPDGSQIAASYHEGGRWGVAVIDARSGAVRRLTTGADVSRHSPNFADFGRELLVVSERGGIANLEMVPLNGAPPRTLTRVTGAVLGPDVSRSDDSIWFLSMRSGGYDLRRLATPDESVGGEVVAIQGPMAPAAPPTVAMAGLPATMDTIATASREYGLGPRRWRILPGGTAGPDGHTTTLMAANIDPIGRLSIVTQGAFGSRGTWRGGSAAAALRRTRLGIDVAVWYVEHEPSLARDHLAPLSTDIRYTGARLEGRVSGEGSSSAWLLRAAVSGGRLKNALVTGASRLSASAEAKARLSRSFGRVTVSAPGGLLVETGESDDESWRRTIGTGALIVGTARHYLRGDWLRGSVTTSATAGNGMALEQFVIGGAANPLVDPAILSQRISLPAVPAGFASGRTVQLIRGTLGGATWEPYFVWVAAGESSDDFKRIAGVERNFAIGSLGFARLPGVRMRAGAAYSFDEPYEYRARAYLSLTFTP